MRLRRLLVAAGLAASGVAMHAHHSITAIYDGTRRVTVDGVVREFLFINPHPFLTVEAPSGSEGSRAWRLELDNRVELVEIGVTSDTWKPGDRVVATGSPSRDPQQAGLYVRRLDRPRDGFWYEQVGSTPRIRR